MHRSLLKSLMVTTAFTLLSALPAYTQALPGEPGKEGQIIIIQGTPTPQDVQRLFNTPMISYGGTGGSVLKWEDDHTLTVFPGEEGKPTGQGGRGGDPKVPINVLNLKAATTGLAIKINGYIGFIPWAEMEKLRTYAPPSIPGGK